jgi:hypothetical protein
MAMPSALLEAYSWKVKALMATKVFHRKVRTALANLQAVLSRNQKRQKEFGALWRQRSSSNAAQRSGPKQGHPCFADYSINEVIRGCYPVSRLRRSTLRTVHVEFGREGTHEQRRMTNPIESLVEDR